MKDTLKKLVTVAGTCAAVLLLTCAFALSFRDNILNHLRVQPGTTSSTSQTNVAEIVDRTGTNAWAFETNTTVSTGSIATNATPTFSIRSGAFKWYSTNESISITQITFGVTSTGTNIAPSTIVTNIRTLVFRSGVKTRD